MRHSKALKNLVELKKKAEKHHPSLSRMRDLENKWEVEAAYESSRLEGSRVTLDTFRKLAKKAR